MTSKNKRRFVLKIGEIFKTTDQGFEAIDTALRKSRKVRLSNMSDALLKRFLPQIRNHQCKEVFLHEAGQSGLLEKGFDGVCEPVSSQWTQDFFGQIVEMAELLTPSAMFHILWSREDGQVKRVFANTDPKCITCSWKKNFMMRMRGRQLYATLYDRQKGLDEIIRKASGASVFRACIIPPALLHRIIPYALKGDYRFILSRTDTIRDMVKKNFDVRLGSEAKIFFVYGGDEANVGSLRLDHEMFSIFWRDDRIYSIMKFENLICSNCIFRVFDTAWKYSKAIG